MKKKILLFIVFASTTHVYAQEVRKEINGMIKSDSLAVSNIHVLNRNSKNGVVSNDNGEFEIEVKLKDTLIFSGIQFYTKIIVIDEKLLKNKYVGVHLVLDTNELDEVFIQHKLTGNLFIDAGKQKIPKSKIAASALDFTPKIANKPYTITAMDRRFTSSDDEIPLFLGGSNGGMNIMAIAGLIISPLKKIGRTRRLEKRKIEKKERIFQRKSIAAMDKIRGDFGDVFFIETIEIPEEHINLFIDYCKPKKIGELFVRNNKIKMIEVFLEEMKEYKELNNL